MDRLLYICLIVHGPVVIYLPNIAWTGVILSGYRPTKIWEFNGIFDHLKKERKKCRNALTKKKKRNNTNTGILSDTGFRIRPDLRSIPDIKDVGGAGGAGGSERHRDHPPHGGPGKQPQHYLKFQNGKSFARYLIKIIIRNWFFREEWDWQLSSNS